MKLLCVRRKLGNERTVRSGGLFTRAKSAFGTAYAIIVSKINSTEGV